MRRLSLATMALAVLTAPLAACSGSEPPATFTGVRTASVASMKASTAGLGRDMHMHRPKDAVLDGPHYTTRVQWTATGSTLSATDARELDTTPVRAPKGYQLVVAAIDPKDTYAAFTDQTASVSVLVDDHLTRVENLPLPPPDEDQPAGSAAADSTVIIVSAPRGADVRLRGTDAGRHEELDLRTGRVLVDSYRMRQSEKLRWTGSTDVLYTDPDFGPVPAKLTAGVTGTSPSDFGQVATLNDYTPALKWAPEGSKILTVPAPGVSTSSDGKLGTLPYLPLHEEFDDRDVFTFRTGDGRTVRARHEKRDLSLGLPGALVGDGTPLTFVVPAGTRAGTVTMDLAEAQLTDVPDADEPGRDVSWTRAPEPITLKVTLDG